jgi:hypothetical protein
MTDHPQIFAFLATRASYGLFFLLFIGSALPGCASIQSSSVETLIIEQSSKIRVASDRTDTLIAGQKKRRRAYESAVSDLHTSLMSVQTDEARATLILSSRPSLDSLSGKTAEAFAYLAGRLNWAKYGGLDHAVRQQFEADFDGLDRLAIQLRDSWNSLDTLSTRLEMYATTGGVINDVDPAFLSALLDVASIDPVGIDGLIAQSSAINKTLRKASELEFVDTRDAKDAAAIMQAVTDLLERMNARDAKN